MLLNYSTITLVAALMAASLVTPAVAEAGENSVVHRIQTRQNNHVYVVHERHGEAIDNKQERKMRRAEERRERTIWREEALRDLDQEYEEPEPRYIQRVDISSYNRVGTYDGYGYHFD